MSLELARSTAKAKRACADKGYVADAFAAAFCPAAPEASGDPLLRRGYYARHRAVDLALRTFLRQAARITPRRAPRTGSFASEQRMTLLPR